jgi:type VI secretion system protein ImpK
MTDEDPFGLYAQGDRTVVIRPQPGGRRPVQPATPFGDLPAAATAGDAFPAAGPPLPAHAGRNPLLWAAVPILSLAPLLRSPRPPGDPEGLRARLLDELNRYREAARAAGADPAQIEQGAWALAALLDDIVLNTPWGSASGWSRGGLVASQWSEVDAGERFFERLATMQREPGRHAPVLELFHRCLALGFEGRYRVARAGEGGIEAVRKGVARVLADLAGPVEPALSPHWQGVMVPARARTTLVPAWVIGTAVLLLLLALFTAFRYRLADYAGQLAPLVARLPPGGPVAILRDHQAAPLPALPVLQPTLVPGFLAEEQRQRLVAVQETAQRVLIRLTAADLFAPGSAALTDRYRALVLRIGQALAERPGRIMVTGHTDAVPLRGNSRFASNQELSEARAATVAALLAQPLQGGARLMVAGKGEREPIADNASQQGRARNRRVEIVLLKTAGG